MIQNQQKNEKIWKSMKFLHKSPSHIDGLGMEFTDC